MSTSPDLIVKSILPSPFEWCEIPTGNVILPARFDDDSGKQEPTLTVKTPRFSIAKYPVTNAQFAKFIEAGGYQNPAYWTKAGWKVRQSGMRMAEGRAVETGIPWTQPAFWTDEKWNGADYPVVGVSWYEAFAFTRWLSEASGAKINLPSEAQWQRAAQGDETYVDLGTIGRSYPGDTVGRAFPWGNEWDATRCNNNVDNKGIGRTTPVTHYEGKGDSPFGVVDMAGNVEEWCLTNGGYYGHLRGKNIPEGDNMRVLLGGSWASGGGTHGIESRWTFKTYSFTAFFHTDFYNAAMPYYPPTDIGFRIIYEGVAQKPKPKVKKTNDAGLLPSSIVTTPTPALLESKTKSILPVPFDWCVIPAGNVNLTRRGARHKGTKVEVPAFYMAKYPITNAQFQLFMDAGGYENQQWWTSEGWQARLQDVNWDPASKSMKPTNIAWTAPRDWQTARINGADHPVINLALHEALAYCHWLSDVSGENITLPTIEQWQRAAQGDDGRAYPWGSIWDVTRCNNDVVAKRNIGNTTPVTQYEGKGDSPFGVVDMTGNAKEWTLTKSSSTNSFGDIHFVVASCSWRGSGSMSYRVDQNYPSPDFLRGGTFGFRIIRIDE